MKVRSRCQAKSASSRMTTALSARQQPGRERVAHGHGDQIEAEQPGDQIGAADQQCRPEPPLERDRGQRRDGVGGLAAARAQQVDDRQIDAADRDRQQQKDDADVKRCRRPGEQQQPDDHQIEREQPGADPMGAARRRAGVPRRMPPDHVEREPDQHDATSEPDQVPGGAADPEHRESAEGELHEEEPADQNRRPDEPEAGGRGRHRHHPEALGAGRQQDLARARAPAGRSGTRPDSRARRA